MVARTINIPEDQLYGWTARRFWFKHIFLAWESHHKANYQKLCMNKK